MEIQLELGEIYRITFKDGTSFRFRFKGNLPNEDKLLCEKMDDHANIFDFKQIGEFKSIEKCD